MEIKRLNHEAKVFLKHDQLLPGYTYLGKSGCALDKVFITTRQANGEVMVINISSPNFKMDKACEFDVSTFLQIHPILEFDE